MNIKLVMKKKTFIIAAACLAMLAACDLDQVPENQVTFKNAFQSENEVNATTSSILYFENIYLGENDAFSWAGVKVDTLAYNNEVREWNPRSVSDLNGMWSGLYNIIYEANLLVDNIGQANLDADREAFHVGQAQFALGISYLFLAQRYGDCVITNNSSDVVMYGRSPQIEVLNKAEECALQAYNILPTFDKLRGLNNAIITSKQYASKGSAAALLAHIYAWRGSMIELYGLSGDAQEDYRKSVEFSSKIIDGEAGNYSLCDSPDELCKKLSNPDEANPEAIFTLTFDKARSEYSQTPCTPATNFLSWPVKETSTIGDLPYDTPCQLFHSTIDKMYPDPNDARRDAFFYDADEVHEVDGIDYAIFYKFRNCIYTPNEWSQYGKDFRSVNCDYVYWRLADIILLRAECEAKLGQTAQATTDLNAIRSRAGAAAYPSEYDDNDLKKAIFKEREKEMIGENDARFFDVIRNGYIKEELKGKLPVLTDNDIKNGALFMPVPSNAYSDKEGKITNTKIRQTTYWLPYIR